MTLRRCHSSAGLRASRVPHVPRAVSHSANLLMVPRMQALMTRLSRRACRSACKNKDRGNELFLSKMVASPSAGFSNRAEVQWCRTRMSSGMRPRLASCSSSSSLSHAVCAVSQGRREPEQACAPGSIRLSAVWPGARPCLGARKLDGHRQPPDFVAGGPTSARGLAHQPDASSRLDPS